jgi:hypothetical protein
MMHELFPFPGKWRGVKDGNLCALDLYLRHYSARHYRDGRERKLFCGPGEKMVLLTIDGKALFVWRKFVSDDGQKGINCAVFRNEGPFLSSDLIKEAVELAWKRWPGERLYTYVNPKKIRSTNPGYCFICSGWTACGKSRGGLVIMEKKAEREKEAGHEK